MDLAKTEKSRAIAHAVQAGYCDEIGRPLHEHNDRVANAAVRYAHACRTLSGLDLDLTVVANVAYLHSLLAFRDGSGELAVTPSILRRVGVSQQNVRRVQQLTMRPGERGHVWLDRFLPEVDFEVLLVAVADYEDHIETLKQSESLYPSPESLHILKRLYDAAFERGYPQRIPGALLMTS